jgi:HlyD family secretion protein
MSRRSIFLLAAIAILVSAGIVWWLARTPEVAGVSVVKGPLVRTLQFSGRVATASRVELGSTLTGRVVQVAVAEGVQVKKGEVLVRLESDELRAALDQAQASERQAAARLAGLRSTGRSSAQAAVAQADSVLIAAQAELQRTQQLVARGFLSEAKLDEVRRGFDVAQAQLASARALSAANADRGTDVAQAQAQLALASAATAAARARLTQAVVVAPADARVLTRNVEPGQIVQPGRAMLSLALTGPVQLVAQVDERYLEQLQVGQVTSVLADAFPLAQFGARVHLISPLVDAQRGAVEVKFSLPNTPPAFLREDMTLSLEVETARRDNALVVPVAGLRGDSVLISLNGRVAVRPVRLGLRTLEAVEVLDGLVQGDIVLTGPAPKPGSRVRANLVAAPAMASMGPQGSQPGKGPREDAGSAMSNAMGR